MSLYLYPQIIIHWIVSHIGLNLSWQLVLVAGTYAGSQNAPVILVGQKDVPKPAKEYLPTSAIKDGTVIGSVESVEEIVRLQLEELVK